MRQRKRIRTSYVGVIVEKKESIITLTRRVFVGYDASTISFLAVLTFRSSSTQFLIGQVWMDRLQNGQKTKGELERCVNTKELIFQTNVSKQSQIHTNGRAAKLACARSSQAGAGEEFRSGRTAIRNGEWCGRKRFAMGREIEEEEEEEEESEKRTIRAGVNRPGEQL